VGAETITFIRECIRAGKILWTYHVNMRLAGRFISRETLLSAVDSFEIIETYPDDKYLPSYLVYAAHRTEAFHLHIAVDRDGDNVRVITAYRPNQDKWEEDLKTRRKG
jgi:hypothetical protein